MRGRRRPPEERAAGRDLMVRAPHREQAGAGGGTGDPRVPAAPPRVAAPRASEPGSPAARWVLATMYFRSFRTARSRVTCSLPARRCASWISGGSRTPEAMSSSQTLRGAERRAHVTPHATSQRRHDAGYVMPLRRRPPRHAPETPPGRSPAPRNCGLRGDGRAGDAARAGSEGRRWGRRLRSIAPRSRPPGPPGPQEGALFSGRRENPWGSGGGRAARRRPSMPTPGGEGNRAGTQPAPARPWERPGTWGPVLQAGHGLASGSERSPRPGSADAARGPRARARDR